MKRLFCVLVCLGFLFGCSAANGDMDAVMGLRTSLLKGGCSFVADIYADYGQTIHTFRLSCEADSLGALNFRVIAPETISGIAGRVAEDSGALLFDDQVLAFQLLADGLLSPVSAPWLLLRGLRGAYISAVGKDGDGLRVRLDDSFQGETLLLDVWLTGDGLPKTAIFSWKGVKILSMEIDSFCLL
jgi:hypothetical protein